MMMMKLENLHVYGGTLDEAICQESTSQYVIATVKLVYFIITSAKRSLERLCFHRGLFVCLSVCLFVSKITQKVMNGS